MRISVFFREILLWLCTCDAQIYTLVYRCKKTHWILRNNDDFFHEYEKNLYFLTRSIYIRRIINCSLRNISRDFVGELRK